MTEAPRRILIVDDERLNINVLVDLLKEDYKTLIAKDGEQALKRAVSDPPPDLVLLDVMMPGMDGHEVCRRLQADPRTRGIPVIFITAMGEVGDETRGFELGAVDYIAKPVSPPVVRARVRTHLMLKEARDFLAGQNERLEQRVQERTRQLSAMQDVAMVAMGSLAETRDNETGNHIRRTQRYVQVLAEHLKDHPRFCDTFTPDFIRIVYKSAPLHDIGKVGVPDRILLKPGRLEPHEFEVMKKHAAYGRDAIVEAEKELGTPESFLRHAREIAYAHHEKWDGSGYPEGLSGDAIPVSARLMAVADVYDALISRRVYKAPMPHEKAVAIIRDGRGTHFDPDMVDAFVAISETFRAIAAEYSDTQKDVEDKAARLT